MKWLGLIILILLILVIVLFLTKIKITIVYKRKKEDDRIHLVVSAWWNLITLKYDVPMLQIQSLIHGVGVKQKTEAGTVTPLPKKRFRLTPEKVRKYIQNVYRLKKRVHDFNEIFKRIFKHIYCDQLEWYTKVGVGDAAITGIMTGALWSIQSVFIGFISRYITFRTVPKMNVTPAFQDQDINTQVHCILVFRIGNVIIAGTRILFKLRKGREGLWQNTLFRA